MGKSIPIIKFENISFEPQHNNSIRSSSKSIVVILEFSFDAAVE